MSPVRDFPTQNPTPARDRQKNSANLKKETFPDILKMPSKESPLVNFLMNALMDNKYPNILFWVNKAEGIFCLRCICKYQKIWSEDTSRIFEDYFKLKSRKSESKRQTFLLALKASPSIETLKLLSTKEEKYYKFLNKTGNLSFVTDSGMISCKNEMAEVSAESLFSTSIDVLCSEFKHEVVETSCFTNTDMNVSCAELKNEVIDIAVESPRFPNPAETMNGENIYSGAKEIELMEDKILKDLYEILGDDVDSILNIENEDCTVPDVEMDTTEYLDDASQSIFNWCHDANSSNSDSCPSFSDSSEDQNYPADYDPTTDLLQSFGENITLNQLKNVEEIPGVSSKYSQYEVTGVYSVDSNDLVKLFEKDEISSDHKNHNYYMMILKTSNP
ncbi:IRF tryptophan pentad repeat domain-containing protein [Trichonephila clavata]|uniref:IRF tryptophan pentad repeat domain-containing protein n=1 Tax=Trichonephila clavata TaxID=2740835 RepID=A0A8X6H9K4_TRICU|nr:IRF tryptophan pentad repeat domain-containing protein [Trichonephila clavata]